MMEIPWWTSVLSIWSSVLSLVKFKFEVRGLGQRDTHSTQGCHSLPGVMTHKASLLAGTLQGH